MKDTVTITVDDSKLGENISSNYSEEPVIIWLKLYYGESFLTAILRLQSYYSPVFYHLNQMTNDQQFFPEQCIFTVPEVTWCEYLYAEDQL